MSAARSITARARLVAVVATVAMGGLGVISSTQTWLEVTLVEAPEHALAVAGAAAVPVLTPLSLAVLALGAALSIVGPILRWVFGAMTVAIAAMLGTLTAQIAFTHPVAAVAPTVTASTGIAGVDAVSDLVAVITSTAWPFVTLVCWVILLAAGVFTLVTARSWRGSGRRYQTDADATPAKASSRPRDAIDSWDDLSRGDDPTS